VKSIALFLGIVAAVAGLSADTSSFDRARSSAEADLRDALERLSALRDEIKEQKVPLSREMNTLQAALREKRRAVERAERRRDTHDMDLNQLRQNVEQRQDEIDYVSNLVAEYARVLEIRMDLAEQQYHADFLQRMTEAAEEPEISRTERLLRMVDVTEMGVSRMTQLVGGYTFPGRAVAPSGMVEPGTYVVLGPTVFFASETGGSGLALPLGAADPNYAPLGDPFDAQINELVREGRGFAPLDPTLGDAFAIAETKETFWEHIQKGGIWIWPILTFAVLAFGTSLFKIFEIYRVKMPRPGSLHEVLTLLEQGKDREALQFAESIPGPVGRMLADGAAHADESKELVEEVLYERMLEVQPKLERLLPFIAVTAATAPLMGLLGTVTGMINTFKLITIFGTGDAKALSSGISEALVTTEFGLIVAIPSLILHALLSRRAQGVMADMERMAVAFVNGLTRNSNGKGAEASGSDTENS